MSWLTCPSLIDVALYMGDHHWCYLIHLYILVIESLLADGITWLLQHWFPARGGLIAPDTIPNAIGLCWPCPFFGVFPDQQPWQVSALIPIEGYLASSLSPGYMVYCESILSFFLDSCYGAIYGGQRFPRQLIDLWPFFLSCLCFLLPFMVFFHGTS